MNKRMTTKQTGRVKHVQGLADFKRLGPDRSLEKLCRQYTQTVPKPPAISTLKIWSTKYGWQAKAAVHDERVAGRVSVKVEDAAVGEAWDRVKDLTTVAQKSIQKALDALEGGNMEAKDPYAVAALMNTALGSIKAVELLSGRATGRFENLTPKDHAPDWLKERLAADAAQADEPSDALDQPETATQH